MNYPWLLRARLPLAVVVFALVLSLIRFAQAETWPRFRGPNGSGVATARTMKTTWTNDDYRWRIELPGMGFSSPVVWDDRVYVTSGDEKEGTQIVQSIDARTGETVWERRFEADAYKKHRLNSYATSTPALDKDRIYVTWGGPKGSTVAALERRTGRELWRYDLGPFVALHNFGASPMVIDDVVVVLNDQDKRHTLVALDAVTGEEKWKTDEPIEADATYATPCCFQPADGSSQLIAVRTQRGVMSLDPRSGRQNWKLDLPDFRFVASPITDGQRLAAVCGASEGGQRLAVIRPGNPQTNTEPEVLRDVEKDLPYVPTPLIHDGLLYLWADSGRVKCIALADGKERWKGRLRGKFYGSPVLAAGKLYGISDKGKAFVLSAGPKYELLGEVDLDENSMSTPAVADGVMYLRTVTHLMALPGE